MGHSKRSSSSEYDLQTQWPRSYGEKGQLRAVTGGIGWVARQARLDEASAASLLQSSFCRAAMKN
eukprot:9399427-Pyramimonas_sp.AAC.1